jgi:hypothetical protein
VVVGQLWSVVSLRCHELSPDLRLELGLLFVPQRSLPSIPVPIRVPILLQLSFCHHVWNRVIGTRVCR